MVGSRIRSGGLSPDEHPRRRADQFANWSSRMFQVTFGNCLVNSSASLRQVEAGLEVAFSTTGSVPQSGGRSRLADGLAPALADAAGVAAGDGAVDG